MHLLFYTRLALYLILAATPAFHPAVAVAYDRVTQFGLFVVVPIVMLAAYYGRGKDRWKWLIGAAGAVLFSVAFISGFNRDSYFILAAAALGYIWTRIVFAKITRFPLLSALELIAFVFIYFKILSFARASEDVARQSAGITKFLLAGTILLFCIHACVLYLAAFPQKLASMGRVFAYGGAICAVLMLGAFFLPSDFVTHNVVLNELEREPPLNPRNLEGEPIDETEGGGKGKQQKEEEQNKRNGKPLGEREEKYPSELQGGREGQGDRDPRSGSNGKDQRQGQGQKNQNQNQRQNQGRGQSQGQNQSQDQGGQNGKPNKDSPKLEGVPADQWNNQQQSGEGQGKQSAVMVIASPVQPVYAAEGYRAKFTVDKSFQQDPADDDLNSLTGMRLMQTWRNQEEREDQFRRPVEIFYLSTLQNRVLAFRPQAIEPTIQDKRYAPFNLSYMALSRMNVTGPDEWIAAGNLDTEEKEQHALYLDVPKDPRIDRIRQHVREITKDKNWQFEKIAAILRSFKTIKYEMGYDEDQNLDKITKFLFETKKGDCTEFSETAALMGRLAGIPSRVVVGYIASKDLQTPAHRGGIYHIRKRIPSLQKYKMDELYLVTTAHHHAWVQFYMPKFGWVDFETTAFAIPPEKKMDPNAQDVLIPLIEEVPQIQERKFEFPYYFAGRVLLALAVLTLAGLYLYRGARTLYLVQVSRGTTPRALDALFRLIILRMAQEGNDVRPPFLTHAEYAAHYPVLAPFAALFTELRFRESYDAEKKSEDAARLRNEYKELLKKIRKPGFVGLLRRTFSLRGIWI